MDAATKSFPSFIAPLYMALQGIARFLFRHDVGAHGFSGGCHPTGIVRFHRRCAEADSHGRDDGSQQPWDIAFTPDGVMLFTEKGRGVSARLADGRTIRLFGTSGSALLAPDLFCQGQSGVHGIAVDPDFAKGTRDIYVYIASSLRKPATNRVVRLTVNADITRVGNRTDIMEDIPYKDAANGAGSAGAHSGGRIRFGPDGFLYVTTGDNQNPFTAFWLLNSMSAAKGFLVSCRNFDSRAQALRAQSF